MKQTHEIKETGFSSKKFGPCEITGEESPELVILKTYRGKGLIRSTFCTRSAAKAVILDSICSKVTESVQK